MQIQPQNRNQICACQQLVPVPDINPCLLFICGICNIIIPGLGCMISACIENNQFTFMSIFMMGLTQLMTSFILIGVIWSWIHAAFFFIFAFERLCSKNQIQDQEQNETYQQPYQHQEYQQDVNQKAEVKENKIQKTKGHIL